ncbi:Alcohol oxidase [Mycena sanguinolenta]|uniref:Alcohol oxidase n=1 Tax=Mycena sanguinolenta TaxID=230812 RepID=A0A8H6Z1U0_9AGAR|nr:Alcohol oxidase [Mycena sanguinolenta]
MILSANQVSNKAFDYIVIGEYRQSHTVLISHGTQTSGLVVATRLSEDPSVSVLVIEAGLANLDDPEILNPAQFASRFGKPQYDWAFQTVPQKLVKNRSLAFNRGKCLGGSSTLNFFFYHRPTKSDIDAFEKLGNPGWNWELLEPYYKKSQHFIERVENGEVMTTDLAHHGNSGPIAVAYPSVISGFELASQLALKNLGIDFIGDAFSGDTKGAWFPPLSINRTGARSYAANEYYQPNAARDNLSVVVCAQVTKIVTEQDQNGIVTAVEVVFICEEESHRVKVGKEVILSAGAIMSPQILEHSGIGNQTILEGLGIETHLHLPGVGENVQEHCNARVLAEVRPEILSELYQTSGTRMFGMPPIYIAFVPLSSISAAHEALQTSLAKTINEDISSKKISPALAKQYAIQLKHQRDREPSCEFTIWPLFRPIPDTPMPGKQYLSVAAFLNHPLSRGSIVCPLHDVQSAVIDALLKHIASSDPLVPPNIDPRYFEYEYDLLQLVEQIKFCRKILEQEPLRKFITGNELKPGPQVQTDSELADFVKSDLITTWHTVGSCSMLPLVDGGVVDRTLKVYNTTNIRVVDLSILPLHVGAHTQATAYALGELGADIIKGTVFGA